MPRKQTGVTMQKRRRSRAEIVTSVAFVLPAVLLLATFVLFSIVWTVRISLNKWDGLMPQMQYVGMSNYTSIFAMPQFRTALKNNFIWAAVHIVFACGVGLILAFLISRLKRGLAAFRTILFLPNVIALTIAATMWAQIYNPSYGILNRFLKAVGLGALAKQWLADPSIVLYATAVVSCWQAYGYYMVLFIAGLQGIDVSLYEAARVDGANNYQQFIHVTIPGLRNVLVFVLSMALINGLKGFATVYAMTGGGPAYTTYLMSLFVYKKAFTEFDFGAASAAAVVLGILIIILTLIFIVVGERLNKD